MRLLRYFVPQLAGAAERIASGKSRSFAALRMTTLFAGAALRMATFDF